MDKRNKINNFKLKHYDLSLRQLQMIRACTIASGRGGAGRTTVPTNLGAVLARYGREACLIDTDIASRDWCWDSKRPRSPSMRFWQERLQLRIRYTRAIWPRDRVERTLTSGVPERRPRRLEDEACKRQQP
ncbi:MULTISPECIES: P-loop NTPase [Methanoculleus]|nr:P-loop NTPase [Methanoculleus thermophilus]